jgi:hypothetical protein
MRDTPKENESAAARTQRRLQQELDEFHTDPQRLGQAQLDHWWQRQLDLRAAAQRRIEPSGVIDPRSGIYDPMQRFEDE